MKTLFKSKIIIWLALLILFFVGQLMGTLSIKMLFINYKVQELSPRLQFITEEIGRGTFTLSRNNDFILKAYDIFGNEMNIFSEVAHETVGISEIKVQQSLKVHMQKAIAGHTVAVLQKIEGHAAESIVIGMPIVKTGKVIGVAFLLKPASDFKAVLQGFYLVFSITLFIGTCFIGLFLTLYLKESKQLEQTRRDYVANISHELKSPIASIRALTETLADQMIRDEAIREKYYGIILKESSRLQKLIDDTLELSRLQSGKQALFKEEICTSDMMKGLVEKYELLAYDLGFSFEVTEKAMSAPNVYTNKDRLVQIFDILINNAFKFVQEEGSIAIDVDIHKKLLMFKVMDNGTGIDPRILPYIFDRFYKEEAAHNSTGSGLGLAIAKELLNCLGETITVSSELGKGAVFMFTVQRA